MWRERPPLVTRRGSHSPGDFRTGLLPGRVALEGRQFVSALHPSDPVGDLNVRSRRNGVRIVIGGALADIPAWRLEAHERAAAALERRGAGLAARAHHVEQFGAGGTAAIELLAAAAAEPAPPGAAARWYGAAAAGRRARRARAARPAG